METLIRRGISWPELEELQTDLVQQVTRDPRKQFLLISEPTPTFTHGPSSQAKDLLWTDTAQRGVGVYPVTRGGKWTYHGPGQVVIYPIASLPALGYGKRAVRQFVGDFAAGILAFLKSKGLEAQIQDNPYGLYLNGAKLASFGLSFRNGISSHGVALYLQSQAAYFEGIVPCGVACPALTSLAESRVLIDWETAALELADYVKRGFQPSKN